MTLPTSNSTAEFWKMLDKLVGESEIVIDRPKGSRHPEYPEIIYPLDYGYIAGTSASDGEEIDIWLGRLKEKKLTAIFVTVDPQKRDCEVKLMLGCSEDEINLVDHFFNDYPSMKALLIRREEER